MFRFITRFFEDDRIKEANARLEEEGNEVDEADEALDALIAKFKQAREAVDRRAEASRRQLSETLKGGSQVKAVNTDDERKSRPSIGELDPSKP